MVIEFVATFWGVSGAFKFSAEKLKSILYLLPWTIEYDDVQSDEWLILSKIILLYAQEEVDQVVLKNLRMILYCCMYLIVPSHQME